MPKDRPQDRRETILKLIVDDYVSDATPVASETLARRHRLGVSPATIRNEVAALEEEGYVTRPHSSAGSVPSEQAYRFYVESILDMASLSPDAKEAIRRQLAQASRDIEAWARMAAVLLAEAVGYLSIITVPSPAETRIKHLELVSLQDFLALLLLVFQEARLKQQLLPLDDPHDQESLNTAARKLNTLFRGSGQTDISSSAEELTPIESKVMGAVMGILEAEDALRLEDYYVGGLHHLLRQPEFSTGGTALGLVEMLENRSLVRSILPTHLGDKVTVTIGGENREDALRPFSIIVAPYSPAAGLKGVLGVVGPTRMEYAKAIGGVNYLASLMNRMMADVYGKTGPAS